MPTINCKDLDKYKTYYTENIKGKNGVTKPITKVKYVKTCPQCGDEMSLIKFKRGGVYKSPIIKWNCNDKKCNHSECEEKYYEMLERIHKYNY